MKTALSDQKLVVCKEFISLYAQERKNYESTLYVFWSMVRDVRFCMICLSRLDIVLKLSRCILRCKVNGPS